MIFSRNRKKGDGDNDKDRDRPKRVPPVTAGGQPSEYEHTFPFLKRVSSNRGIIPILVMISLLFGIIIASMLLRQAPSGGWEAPPQRQTLSDANRASEATRRTEVPPQRTGAATSVLSEATRFTTRAASPAVADEMDQPATPTPAEDPTDGQQGETKAAVTEIPAVPPTQSPAPEPTEAQETVEPIRGVQRFSYMSNTTSKYVTAFPIAAGLFLLTQGKPGLTAAPPSNDTSIDEFYLKNLPRYARSQDLVESRYACLCADTLVGAATFKTLAEALESSLNGARPQSPFADHRRDSLLTPSAEGSALRFHPNEGRHPVHLADGHLLETRVMPCTGIFYSSAAIALCDPLMNASTLSSADDGFEQTQVPTPSPMATSRRNQRPPPTPAMVPIGPCSALDDEVANSVLESRLYIPANSDARRAFLSAAAHALPASLQQQAVAKRRRPMGPRTTEAPQYFYDQADDAAEIKEMCDQCGAEPKAHALEGGQPDTRFHDPHRFRPIFFEKERHPLLIDALRGVSKSNWQAVRALTAKRNSDPVKLPQSSATQDPDPVHAGVNSGLVAMDTMANRCDKRGKSEHFAQCFHHAHGSRKAGNWTRQDRRDTQQSPALQLTPSRFFSNLTFGFPIPSRLMLHPLNIGGHVVCYASGDMVCDIVGRTGGWEGELIQIVAYAASELRKLNRQAGSILAARMDLRSVLSNITSAAQYETEISARIRRHQLTQSEFSLGSLLDREDLSTAAHLENDVTFIDVGGNVGVFAASMWKRGYRTEVFEALPHNVFLLESTRCTNQAEEFANWEEARASRIQRAFKFAEQTHYTTIRRQLAERNNTTAVSHEDIERELDSRRESIRQDVVKSLSPYFSATKKSGATYGGGPWMPRFEVHHSALGNGRKGRSGDEAFEFALNESMKTSPQDDDIAARLNNAARTTIDDGNGTTAEAGAEQECVMISEKQNFGDIVILCNETLVAEAKSALKRFGSARARVLKEYIPRGFVHLTSLDRVLQDPSEGIDLENSAMSNRFSELIANPEDAVFPTVTPAAEAAAVGDEPREGDATTAAPLSRRRRAAAHFSPAIISTSNTTQELLNFVRYSQVVMKIDVEGQEEYVLQGAHRFLSNTSVRPRLILSEIWRKMNVARYGAFMINVHGYVGLALSDRVWLRSTQDVLRFHRTMSREMDTIVWVLPEYQFLIPPSAFERRPQF